MKYRVLAIFQLVILVLYLIRPIIPFIEYAVNKDFIAKNLCVNKDKPRSCCHGKCYLEKQVKKNAETNDGKEQSNSKKVQNEEVKEFLCNLVSIPDVFSKSLNPPVNSETTVSSKFVSAIFIPPQKKFIL